MEEVPRPAPGTFGERLADGWSRLRSDPRVGAALVLCVAVAAGIAWFRAGVAPSSPPAASPTTIAAGSGPTTEPNRSNGSTPSSSSTSTSAPAADLIVDVVGAVRKAGVVTLPPGSRVVDAISAAGGPAANADVTRLNLAAALSDGARVAVPVRGQPAPALDPAALSGGPAPTTAGAKSGASGSGTSTPAAPVDINTANAAELDALPGVGPSTAAAIVTERDAHGPFASVDDLVRVKGIGPAKLEQLHAFARV